MLKIGVYYPAYLEQFYAGRPGLAALPYDAQHAALIDDCFGSSDFWTTALAELGYETRDLVANAEPLQKRWAAERGLSFAQDNWLFDIAEAQIRDFSPDVLIVADYSTVTAAFLRRIRDACPTIRLVLGWCGAPYGDGAVFGECDIVLSCVPELVAHFRAEGHRSRHVNHAFEPRVLKKIDLTATSSADFVFIGSIVKADQFHLEREKILSRLVKETGLQIWSESGPQQQPDPPQSVTANLGRAARRAARLFVGGASKTSSSLDEHIARRARPPLFGLAMFQQLHDSRVALNTHIDVSTESASNMRLFEATGVGTCLLTDWKTNLHELFELDAEVIAYRDASECVEKVKYLLEHEAERRSVAAAGQRRTLREHTFTSRAAQIDAIIHEALSNT
ncbi:MAG: glycosyltransferase [Pyrinomonadaceae bacterium]